MSEQLDAARRELEEALAAARTSLARLRHGVGPDEAEPREVDHHRQVRDGDT